MAARWGGGGGGGGEARGVDRPELPVDEVAAVGDERTPEVRDVLTVAGSVSARNARGGTAPAQVARQLDGVLSTAARLRSALTR